MELNYISISDRKSKLLPGLLAKEPTPIPWNTLDFFPQVLAANHLKWIVEDISVAREKKIPVIMSFGGAVVKTGLGLVVNKLVSEKFITCLSTVGSSIIHDAEIGLFGETSEDVSASMKLGNFGTTKETHEFLLGCMRIDEPIGYSVGKAIALSGSDYTKYSIFSNAYLCGVPATVHECIGTDILHMNPKCRGDILGASSMEDFRRLLDIMRDGRCIILNFGQADIMPEVFLKIFAILRNQRISLHGIQCVNFDMIQGYRCNSRLIDLVKELGGRGSTITGHHEINLPLLAGLLLGYEISR